MAVPITPSRVSAIDSAARNSADENGLDLRPIDVDAAVISVSSVRPIMRMIRRSGRTGSSISR